MVSWYGAESRGAGNTSIRPRIVLMRTAIIGLSVSIAIGVLAPDVSQAQSIVHFQGYTAGTIVVKTSDRRLYYVLGENEAIRYPVGVGKAGKVWSGNAYISGKYLKPGWSPPDEIRRDKPSIPDLIPGGSTRNPMGAAALTLSIGQYAIHGTNSPGSIGHFVSYGCIRMHNRDILDLYHRVSVGTSVVVLR